MGTSPLSDQGNTTTSSEVPSLATLLERGIQCMQQEYYAEGLAFFALAGECLAPDQIHFAAVLDAFVQSHHRYLQAQQALHLASKRFAETDTEQQVQLLALEKLLAV